MFNDKMKEDFLWYTYFGITKIDAEKDHKKALEKCVYRAYLDMCRTISFSKSNNYKDVVSDVKKIIINAIEILLGLV